MLRGKVIYAMRINLGSIEPNAAVVLPPDGDYNVVLEKVRTPQKASTGTWGVSLQFRLQDNERYNGYVVFLNLYATEKAFPAVQRAAKFLTGDTVKAEVASWKQAAEATYVALKPVEGKVLKLRLYARDNRMNVFIPNS